MRKFTDYAEKAISRYGLSGYNNLAREIGVTKCVMSQFRNEKATPSEETFLKIVELNLVDFDFWYLMSKEQVEKRIKGLKERYPDRELVPFARRDDSDDIACFDIKKNSKVQIIHDFASAGYEQRKEYNTFWEWFKEAIQEMIDEEEADD